MAGDSIIEQIRRTKNSIKQLVVPGMLFEDMGITYLGLFQDTIFPCCAGPCGGKEGRGACAPPRPHPEGKGVQACRAGAGPLPRHRPFDIETGKPLGTAKKDTYTDIFSKVICDIGKRDPKVAVITAAMADGTGLSEFRRRFPRRFFDVGIAEGHAVTFAAGLAAGG